MVLLGFGLWLIDGFGVWSFYFSHSVWGSWHGIQDGIMMAERRFIVMVFFGRVRHCLLVVLHGFICFCLNFGFVCAESWSAWTLAARRKGIKVTIWIGQHKQYEKERTARHGFSCFVYTQREYK